LVFCGAGEHSKERKKEEAKEDRQNLNPLQLKCIYVSIVQLKENNRE
jgi:hypothetical protein